MSAFTDWLINTLSGALETVGESKLIEVLQKLHDKDIAQYTAAIFGGYALVQALSSVVEASKTQIDDAILNALGEAIQASASANGIVLPVEVPPTDPVV